MSGYPTEQPTPEHNDNDGLDNNMVDQTVALVPGGVLDGGRYRLLSWIGNDSRCDAQLWRARDAVLGREVALTVLVGDRSDADAAANARRTLERAMHASTFNHVGVARVLDVVTQAPGDPRNVLGIVIAEWTEGTDLLDLVAYGPLSPGSASRLLCPLAAAVEAAHHAGLVLGADHPQRIRVTAEGEARMAFPGPLPDAGPSDDVHGLGAALYLLLTGRWALPGGPEGLPSAPTGPDGTVVGPRTLRPAVPLELSTIAVRSLENHGDIHGSGGVRTGAAILQVLEQYASMESDTTLMRAVPAGSDDPPQELWQTEDPKPDKGKRRKLLISTGVLAALTLLVLGWIGAQFVGIVSPPSNPSGPELVVEPTENPAVPPPQGPVPAGPVPVTNVSVYSPQQTADHPEDAGKAVDANPRTGWKTDTYNDQFGTGFKNGVGLVLTLPQAQRLAEVTVASPTPGTKVEIRTSPSPTPPSLASTQVIGSADLNGQSTPIKLKEHPPTQYVMVWVSALGRSDGGYSSEISQILVTGAR